MCGHLLQQVWSHGHHVTSSLPETGVGFGGAWGGLPRRQDAADRLHLLRALVLTRAWAWRAWGSQGNAQQIAVNAKKAGAGGAGGEIFENEFSGMVNDQQKRDLCWEYSMEAVKDYL